MSENFQLTKGSAAAILSLIKDNELKGEMTLDWSFDAIDFRYGRQEWITLSIGPKTNPNDSLSKIDTPEKVLMFKSLGFYLLGNLPNYSVTSDSALEGLRKIMDSFV